MEHRVPPSPTDLRAKLETLEALMSDPSTGPIENCELYINYWRVRASLASQATRQVEDGKGGFKAPTLAQQKMAYLHMKQASDQVTQWEQRRTAALQLAELELMRRCEEKIAKKHSAADALDKIRT